MNLTDIAARCADTPTITVFEPRGLRVRDVQFNRATDRAEPAPYVTRYSYGVRGEQLTCSDARFSADFPGGQVNSDTACDLQQRPIRERNVDSGEKLQIWGVQGQPSKIWQTFATLRHQQRYVYDFAGRPLAFYQQQGQQAEQLCQRWQYGDGQSGAEWENRRGQCTTLYDSGGVHVFSAFDLCGRNQYRQRIFLADREQVVDWHHPPLLEQEQWHTESRYCAEGELHQQALYVQLGDMRRRLYQQTPRYNRQRQLTASMLLAENGEQQTLLQQADYDAAGECIRERLGNGVEREYEREPQTRRLLRLSIRRSASTGQASLIQEILCQYDPVGNVTAISDTTQDTRYFANRRISAPRQYRYDACYQLEYATGRELAGARREGPQPGDPLAIVQYERWYQYDRGGNLQTLLHRNAAGNRPQSYVTASRSNRTLMQTPDSPVLPEEVDDYFDRQGNLLMLNGGQTLSWDSQQRLSRVVSMLRENGEADYEHYQYDGNGIRCSKITSRVADGETLTRRQETVTYLPGLRICRQYYAQRQQGSHYSLTIPLAGHSTVTCVYQEGVMSVMLVRYGCLDAQTSVALELSAEGDIITQEEYYPYGGTALYTARCDAEAEQKYYRYSGKERDNLSGLYDYGFRYYAPWLCRWISPDPLGMAADGSNLYGMVCNNPITFHDIAGLMPGKRKGRDPLHWMMKRGKEAIAKVDRGLDKGVVAMDWVEDKAKEQYGRKKHYVEKHILKKTPQPEDRERLLNSGEGPSSMVSEPLPPETEAVNESVMFETVGYAQPDERTLLFQKIDAQAASRMKQLQDSGKYPLLTEDDVVNRNNRLKAALDGLVAITGKSHNALISDGPDALYRQLDEAISGSRDMLVYSIRFGELTADMRAYLFSDQPAALPVTGREQEASLPDGESPSGGLWSWLREVFVTLWQRLRGAFLQGSAYSRL